MKKRFTVSLHRTPALTARRTYLRARRCVFLLIGNRSVSYPLGRSRIQFIGTTKDGISGLPEAIAKQTDAILRQPGVTSFEARLVTCATGRTSKAWVRLQRELLFTFREHFGAFPVRNRGARGAAGYSSIFLQNQLVQILLTLS